ncbi:MAG: glycosyl transferase family 36 [Bacteroidetes bacterium]|nr:glycosyl transferase family 36 [Bacteroidota bacterium]
MKLFETKYGYFSEDGDEYIIKTYQTPKPWINVISNGVYGLTISQAGGGFSWYEHSEFNRLTRWHQDLVQDNWGKYIYIKNNKTGDVWSPTFQPVKTELNKFECIHGFGYTKFNSIYKGVEISLTIFVPFDESIEIWDLKIANKTNKEVDLSIYTYFEWCLGSSADHHREFHKSFLETEFDAKSNVMTATKRLWEIPLGDRGHWNIDYPYLGFLSSNKKISDYDSNKDSFLGQLGDLIKPAGIFAKNLSKKTGSWGDPIGSIKVNCKLKPKGTDRIAFYLGLKENKKEIKNTIKKFSSNESIDKALSDVKKRWNELLGTLVVDTPDEAMNLLTNKWLKYQAISGRLWARTAYYQQSGAFGFRDQLQDSLVFLPINPELTEKQIKLHAKHQMADGSVLHWWHPISETGLETKMTDDLLWLPFLMIHYLKETNNINLFNFESEYYDDKNLKETIYKHCIKAIEKVLTRLSNRGITLIGAGDWNDGLSAVGLEMKGESFWLTEFLYYILHHFIPICEKLGDNNSAARYRTISAQLKEAFDKYSWDGGWYIRATKDNDEIIGSNKNKEGKIYLNAQTWAVLSLIGDQDKNQVALQSLKKYLLKKNGPLLLYPAYSKPDKYIGYLSRYAAGRRENGGVYTHAATWAIWAFAETKNGELPYEIFKRLSPIYNGMNPDEYFAEPYVTPGNIEGPNSPLYGRGGWTWYTGSAAWFQKVIVDRILGIRSDEKGLIVDPCIPKKWKSYSVKRIFRDKEFIINVFNPNHVNSGVKSISVNGKIVSGNIICIENDEKKFLVDVYLG